MSLIFTNKKTLNETAIIAIDGSLEPTNISTEGDITIIKNKDEIIAVNIRNYKNYFSAKAGVHSLNEEQRKFFEKRKIQFDYSSRIIVGEIIETKPHPKSQRLIIVRAKADKTRDFVSNIKDLKSGDKILIALTGVTLPNGISIKAGKIAGIESNVAITTEKTLLIQEGFNINNFPIGTTITF